MNNSTRVINKEELNVLLPYEKTEDIYIEKLKSVDVPLYYRIIKRLFDIVFSLLAIIVMLLPSFVIAILIRLTSEGPAFFVQERLGKDGKPFNIIKFRTMVKGAEKEIAMWSLGEDERVTGVGRFLRQSRLDEIPQFFNILSGKMSLIGPRPERSIFYHEFEKYIHGFSERLKVKPGLTGYAQVYGGYLIKPEEKIRYDMEYIQNRSLLMDTKIFFKTIQVLFIGEQSNDKES